MKIEHVKLTNAVKYILDRWREDFPGQIDDEFTLAQDIVVDLLITHLFEKVPMTHKLIESLVIQVAMDIDELHGVNDEDLDLDHVTRKSDGS